MRAVVGAAAAVCAAAALLFGGALRGDRDARASPLDAQAAAYRGYAALDRARVAVDPSRYPIAQREFEEALRLGGADALALRGLSALAAARHRFGESLALARRAQRLNPGNAAVYGLLGDANVELGRYEQAFAAFDRMASVKPGPTAYARISYGRELLGDTDGAIAAMRMSAESARGGEPQAWATVLIANLYAGTGRYAQAERIYREVLRATPFYAPALGGLASLAPSDKAERLYRRALSVTPSPAYAVGLADVLAARGEHVEAERLLRRAHELEETFRRFGGRNELETALIDLDHDRNLRAALRRTREGARLRPSVEGEHALAWALYKNGRCGEARKHSVRALALGTKDVGAIYHRHLIEGCLGHEAAAEAFLARVRSIDPRFLDVPPSAYRLP